MHLPRLTLCACLCSVLLAACGPKEPLRIGFIGGLSGSATDLGEAGRAGFQLAVAQANTAGGVHGRQVEVLIKDDAQDPLRARQAADELVAAGVVAIVGPMTDAMAESTIAAATPAGIAVVSPTVATTELSGRDDQFLRIAPDIRSLAAHSARFHFERHGGRRVAAIIDVGSRAYAESWLAEFRKAFTALGGAMAGEVVYTAGAGTDHAAIVRQLLATRPDGLLLISDAADTARFAAEVRAHDGKLPLIGVDRAADEQLAARGGAAVDGLFISQSFDREDRSSEYQRFRAVFESRFGRPPEPASVAAYDATKAVLDAIWRARSGTSMKQALLDYGPFAGAQQGIRFDRFGDSARPLVMTTVRDGRFAVVD